MAIQEQTAPDPGNGRGYVDIPAIFAGAIVAAGITVVLASFSVGLGLGSFSFDENGGISIFMLILTGLVSVVSLVAAYMLGGYIAGRMRRRNDDGATDETTARDGIHGLVVWGLGVVLSGLLAAGAVTGGVKAVGGAAGSVAEATGSVVGGTVQGAGQLVGGVAQGAGQAVAPTLFDMMPHGLQSNPIDYISNALLRANTNQPAATPGMPAADNSDTSASDVSGVLVNVVTTGEISEEDQNFLRETVAARTGLSPAEVDARVTQAVDRAKEIRAEAEQKLEEAKAQAEQLKAEAEQKIQEAKDQAAKIAEEARVTGILSAFLLAASALVAAAAAYIGAVRGGIHRDEGRIWNGLSYRRQ
ncbi:ATP synthase F0 subunit B [Paracoccus sp. (in: a-proteobacteria)]|uniref:ATP synthase F0 subunit B n=1 Tax=Paracoccus sp. TaxID=267 RepID=UPI002AFE30E8|nr:ATP synthase F0 subunit B [Paracoccus sp. (in: a-proteobacteria)]